MPKKVYIKSFQILLILASIWLVGCAHIEKRAISTDTPILPTRGIVITSTPIPTVTTYTFDEIRDFSVTDWNRPNNFPENLETDSIWDITLAQNGKYWLATTSGVITFDGINWNQYGTESGLVDSNIYAIKVTRGADIWAGSNRGSIFSFKQDRWVSHSVHGTTITSIVETPDGTIWFGNRCSPCEGLGGVLAIRDQNWKRYEQKDGLADDSVWDMVVDQQGNLVVATSQGLSRYNGKEWFSITINQLWGSDIQSIMRKLALGPNGDIWIVVSGKGITWLKPGGDWKNIIAPINPNTIFIAKDGTVWFGSSSDNGGPILASFDGKKWIGYEKAPFKYIYSIFKAVDGTLWLGTERGVYQPSIPK